MYKDDSYPVIVKTFLFEIDELEDFINSPDINVLEIINFNRSPEGFYVTIMYRKN